MSTQLKSIINILKVNPKSISELNSQYYQIFSSLAAMILLLRRK